MLRSWLLGVFVIGLTGYLVVRSQFGQADEEGPGTQVANATSKDALGDGEDAGSAQDLSGSGRPMAAHVTSATVPAGSTSPEGRAARSVSEQEGAGQDLRAEQGPITGGLEGDGSASMPAEEEGPLSFQFQRPGGGTVADREQARQEAREMIRLAQETESPVGVARYLTRALLSGGLEPEEDQSIYQSLLEVHRSGLLSSRNLEGCFIVEVKPGDNLWDIASFLEREGHPPIAPGLLQWLNGMRSDRLRVGQKLKVPVDPLSIQIVKGRYRLHVFLGDILLRRFDVGLGKPEAPTPEGIFRIEEKTVDPAWDGPDGRIAFGQEGNPLGTRWLGFDGGDGYGIHGTWDPASIRGHESNGCIRMLNEEVEVLFNWVPRGAKVQIVP